MAHDYFKHFARDAYATSLAWEGDGFAVRLPWRFGGRASIVMPFASWGALLVVPVTIMLFDPGIANAREAGVVAALLAIGLSMLLVAAHFAFQHLRLEGNADELVLKMAPLPPRSTKVIPLAAIASVTAARRALSRWQRFGARGPNVDLTYQPWTVVIVAEGEKRIVLPLHLRPEDAERLAADLCATLEEAKRRRAERGGFRG